MACLNPENGLAFSFWPWVGNVCINHPRVCLVSYVFGERGVYIFLREGFHWLILSGQLGTAEADVSAISYIFDLLIFFGAGVL